MADRIQSYKVICSGGLNSNENHLDLAENYPGTATRLVNYEVSDYGGYRRIEGFDEYDTNYGEVGVGAAEGAGWEFGGWRGRWGRRGQRAGHALVALGVGLIPLLSGAVLLYKEG